MPLRSNGKENILLQKKKYHTNRTNMKAKNIKEAIKAARQELRNKINELEKQLENLPNQQHNKVTSMELKNKIFQLLKEKAERENQKKASLSPEQIKEIEEKIISMLKGGK